MKQNEKGFSVVEGLLVLIVVLLIGATAWLVNSHQNTKPQTLDAVLSSISDDAKKTFSNATFEPKYDWNAEASATAFNRVDGYDYAVSGVGKGIWLAYEGSDKSVTTKQLLFFTRTIPPAKSLDEIKSWAGNKLISYGFTTSDHQTYQNGSNTCNILNDPTSLFPNQSGNSMPNTNLLEVTCFGKDVAAGAAAQMKPFVSEYLQAHSNLKASDLTVGPLTIKSRYGAGVIGSSRTAGYDIAEMIVSTKSRKQIALYYAKNADASTHGNSGWHYVTEANDEFGFKCVDMKADPDSRKALYDQVCLSEAGQVRLDTNNRALQ